MCSGNYLGLKHKVQFGIDLRFSLDGKPIIENKAFAFKANKPHQVHYDKDHYLPNDHNRRTKASIF